MLKEFHALPTEARVREMKDRDYLWCLVNLVLDGEEERETLCPTCRARAEEERCPVCGDPAALREAGTNPNFDLARFARQKGGQA